MIDLAGIPAIPGNMVALREHAMMIAVAGTGYIDTGERVHNTWQGLRPHYVAPEAAQLLAATGPVATVCRHVGRNLQEARDVLVVYADTVETIQGELDALRTRATDVNTSIRDAGDDWRSDHDLVDRREAVADAITIQAVAFETAQRDCANGLRALHGQPALAVDNGDGQIDPAAEFGYTLDQYRDAYRADPDEGGGLPWGGHAERDYPWYVDVASAPLRFGQGIGDSVVGTAQGLGALIGYDHATGSWTGDTAGAAWTNLGKLVLAAGVYATPGGYLRDQAGAVPFLAPGEAGQLLTDTGKALIAWDQWDDDPARAAGHAVTNIALALVGTKGAGAGLRVGGAALQLTRHGSLTASAGAGLVRAGEAIGRIPTLTEVAGNAWRRLHPPDIPTAPTIIDDTGTAPRSPAPGQTVPGNLADDLTTRRPGDGSAAPPGTGRSTAGGDDPQAGRAPAADAPGTGPGARHDPIRRSQDDTDIDELNDADASPADRTPVIADDTPASLHANGAESNLRAFDTQESASARSGSDAHFPVRDSDSSSASARDRGIPVRDAGDDLDVTEEPARTAMATPIDRTPENVVPDELSRDAVAATAEPGRYTGSGLADDASKVAEAASRYDAIRAANDDIEALARSSGIDERILADVKQHLFNDYHDLLDSPGIIRSDRFTPDLRIAQLWEDVGRGSATELQRAEFERLIAHEYVELRLMREAGLPYRSDHPSNWEDHDNFPRTDHYGAHDRSTIEELTRPHFDHYRGLKWRQPTATIGDHLQGIDDVIDQLLEEFR